MQLEKLEISEMKIEDLETISKTLTTEFDDFWNYNVFMQELNSSTSKYIVVKNEGEVIGFAGIIIALDEADISNIVVKKNYRNKKIGSLLLANLIKVAKDNGIKTMYLEVRETNLPAIHLYEKFGFVRSGLRKRYYNNLENALLMKNDFYLTNV